ncbi:nucleotidyltransferase family protein [soil metagenome]
MSLSDADITLITNFFTDKPVLKAYLFGSHSRNEAAPGSDIDILIELDYAQHIGLGFVQMKLDLEKKLHKKVDLVSAQALSKYIKPFVEKDKVLIYEK